MCIRDRNGTLTGKLTGAKRDYIVAFILTFLFGLFLLVGGKSGIMTILSLGINLITFYIVLVLYKNGTNILLASIPIDVYKRQPHTSLKTILSLKKTGDVVNLENDCIGKYVDQMCIRDSPYNVHPLGDLERHQFSCF